MNKIRVKTYYLIRWNEKSEKIVETVRADCITPARRRAAQIKRQPGGTIIIAKVCEEIA